MESSVHPEDKQLNVIIVGAGLCGLSMAISVALAGHRVSVFEAHHETHEFGAGLQSSPNGTRIYAKWGLADSMKSIATPPEVYEMRRFDGTVLAQRKDYDAEVHRRYSSPLWALHRVDLQETLLRKAITLGANISYGSKVVDVRSSETYIELEDGSRHHADLVVIADGVWSKLRSVVLGQQVEARPTGDIAYRITLKKGEIKDKQVLAWMKTPRLHVWIGPGAHAVSYSVRGGEQLNLVLLATQDFPGKESRTRGSVEELQNIFAGWDPL